MALPLPERYSPKDAAEHLGTSESYVEDMVRTMQFSHIVVVGEVIGGSRLTRHLYFDRDVWFEHFGDRLEEARQNRKRILQIEMARITEIARKTKPAADEGLKIHLARLRSADKDDISETHIDLGRHEVANLWCPYQPRKEYERPPETQVYIPRSALEAFKKKHGIKKANESTEAPAGYRLPSPADEESVYTPKQTAYFLRVSEDHVYRLIGEGKLKAKSRGNGPRARKEISGKEINRYNQQNLT